jgi:hypothetical protein
MNSLMAELLEGHIRSHVLNGKQKPTSQQVVAADEVIRHGQVVLEIALTRPRKGHSNECSEFDRRKSSVPLYPSRRLEVPEAHSLDLPLLPPRVFLTAQLYRTRRRTRLLEQSDRCFRFGSGQLSEIEFCANNRSLAILGMEGGPGDWYVHERLRDSHRYR